HLRRPATRSRSDRRSCSPTRLGVLGQKTVLRTEAHPTSCPLPVLIPESILAASSARSIAAVGAARIGRFAAAISAHGTPPVCVRCPDFPQRIFLQPPHRFPGQLQFHGSTLMLFHLASTFSRPNRSRKYSGSRSAQMVPMAPNR